MLHSITVPGAIKKGVILISQKKKRGSGVGGRANNPNYSAFFKQLLEAFVFLMYPKC